MDNPLASINLERNKFSQRNLDLVYKFYSALFEGDWDTMAPLTSPDFRVVIAESMPHGGEYHGIDGFKDLWMLMSEDIFAGLRPKVLSMSANQDYVFTLFYIDFVAKPTGKAFSMTVNELASVDANGLIAGLKPIYWDTKTVLDNFSD